MGGDGVPGGETQSAARLAVTSPHRLPKPNGRRLSGNGAHLLPSFVVRCGTNSAPVCIARRSRQGGRSLVAVGQRRACLRRVDLDDVIAHRPEQFDQLILLRLSDI